MNVVDLLTKLNSDPGAVKAEEVPDFWVLLAYGLPVMLLGAGLLWLIFGKLWAKERKAAQAVEPVEGAVGFLAGILLLILAPIVILPFAALIGPTEENQMHMMAALAGVIKIAATIGIMAMLLKSRPQWRPHFGRPKLGPRDLALPLGYASWLIIMFGFELLSVALVVLTGDHEHFARQDVANAFAKESDWLLWAAIFGPALSAPIVEEIAFRGMLFGSMRKHLGFWGAALISSVVFLYVHNPGNNVLFIIPIFGFSMCLAWIYEATRNIWYSILFHAIHNTVTLIGIGAFS